MPATETAKALTLRLDPDLHNTIAGLAKSRCQSVNTYIQQSLKATVRIEEEKARYDAYTLLGQDAEECDVEYAIHAQSEVMLRDEF